jgi:hypothetical protein
MTDDQFFRDRDYLTYRQSDVDVLKEHLEALISARNDKSKKIKRWLIIASLGLITFIGGIICLIVLV